LTLRGGRVDRGQRRLVEIFDLSLQGRTKVQQPSRRLECHLDEIAFGAQPENCAPIHASFIAGTEAPVPIEPKPTIAEGTAISHPVRLREVLRAIRRSGGATVAVGERDIVAALGELAATGLYAEPTSAIAAAAFGMLVASGTIGAAERTVVVLTGTGLKATQRVGELLAARR